MPRRLGQVYLDPEKNGRIYEQERDSIDVGWLFFVKIPTKGNSNDIWYTCAHQLQTNSNKTYQKQLPQFFNLKNTLALVLVPPPTDSTAPATNWAKSFVKGRLLRHPTIPKIHRCNPQPHQVWWTYLIEWMNVQSFWKSGDCKLTLYHHNGTLGNAPKRTLAHSGGSTLPAIVSGESSDAIDHMSLAIPTNGTLRRQHGPSPKKQQIQQKHAKFKVSVLSTSEKRRCIGFL